ncbi:16430_t:CDS:10, partial [Funneliformis geosporum]
CLDQAAIMKIKKTPPKKLAAPIPPIKILIQKLNECREEEIPVIVDSVKEWSYSRGDLFHWITVLNRFDSILENICQNYKLKKLQAENFTEETRSVLLAILKFSRMLLENCTNRNLYSSYEHLNDLMYTSDLGVLEVLLRLILRPAQRLSNQRALRTNFTISQERILTLVHSWGTKEYDIEMAQLASEEVKIPEELTTLNYQFYRRLTPSEAAETTGEKKNESVGSAASTPQKGKRKDSASSTGGAKAGEGVALITVNNIHQFGKTDMDILNNIVEEYNIPEEFHYALLNRIRIVTSITSIESRRKFLIIRILAIAIMAHVIPEHIAQSKLFLYEPDIVANLAEFVHPDRNIPIEIQTVAFYALDGISRYRSKLSEVLSAINAAANHGILLYVLRRVIADLDSKNPIFNQEYYDAVFALISYFITSQTGGTMVISAGIVPTLLQLLNNKNPQQSKNITKVVSILDSLVYGFTPSFTSFCNANGVRTLVQRINEEVDYGIQLLGDNQEDFMEDVTIAGSSASTNPPVTEPSITEITLPYEKSSLLKSMFKFVLHMMQSAGTADGLRNLIDTSLPDSIKKVFEQPKVFGSSIFALAINIIATFIHNEPTSLPIMQEAKLPQTFLKSIVKEIPASVDVIQSIPNAFGAICLNSQGMEIFTQMNPIDKFFSIFTSTEHLRSLQDGDVASVLGTNIDELMRHHPSLKPSIMNAIMNTLQRILELGRSDSTIVSDDTNILHAGTDDDQSPVPEKRVESESSDITMGDVDSVKPEEKKENIIVSFIEIAAKFLEGLFQTPNHCKEFLRQEVGLNIILKFYALPTVPYDFASSQASYSLSHLMRVIAVVDSKRSVTAIISALNEAFQGATNFLNHDGKGGLLADYIDLKINDAAKVEEANKTFRSLITLHGYVGLLSDVYCTPVFSHGKNASSVIEAFVGSDSEVIPSLGKLHRTCVWENVILKSSVPKSWYASQTKPKKPFSLPEISAISALLDENDKEITDSNEPPVDQNNRQVKNAKYFKFLVSQIPSCLTPLFQGLAKMLFTRKQPDTNQKALAFKVSNSIAEVLRDHLTWSRYSLDSETDSTNKYNYLTVMLGLLSLLFLDERNQVSLQTMLVLSFVDKADGLECVFTLLRQFWEEAEAIKAFEEYSTIEADDKSKNKLTRIHGCIEVTLNFFQFVASSKFLHDSAQTASITSKDREPRFDPFEFLVNVRAKILPVIHELWLSSYLTKAPPNILRSVVQNLVQILKAEGEVNQRPEGSSNLSAPSSLFGRSLIPDEDRVQQLIDMGFQRSNAETALIRCNNHVETAAEYLLTHPHTIAATIFSEAQTVETGRDSSTNNTTTVVGNAPTDTNTTTGSNFDISGVSGDDDEEISDNDESNNMEQEDILAQALALSMQDGQTAERSNSSEVTVPMETESTTSKKSDKGKGKEVASVDQFKSLREELKTSAANRAIELLDHVEEVIFEVKDLFVLLSKDNVEKTIELVIKSVENARGQSEELRKKALSSRLRLLALLLNETSIQGKISHLPFNIFSDMLSMVAEQSEQPSESSLPKWLAPALLVIESFISLSDEPTTVELNLLHSKLEESEAIVMDNNSSPTDIHRSNLLEYCLSFMKRKDLDKDIINSLLRILVRLTRRHLDATEFVKKDGLSLLFNAFKPRAHDFRGQQIFIVMILRHIIEDVFVLESIMEREIKNWFTNPRPRVVDINAYLRNTAQFALRNPELFVQSTKKLCKLTRYEPGRSSQHQITLIKQEPEEASNTTNKDNTVNEEEMTDAAPSSSTFESPKKLSFGSEVAENLIHFIANELISIRNIQSTALQESKPTDTAHEKQKNIESVNSVTTNNNNISITNNTNNATNITGPTQPPFKPEEHLDYLCRCFLLQCLTELLSSYPSCKTEVINLSRRRNSVGPGTPFKTKTPLLSYLLNDLLPYGCITSSTDIEMRKRYGQSKWTTSVIVALCSNISNDVDEKKVQHELVQVRKFVLDGIIRSFKYAISSSDPIESKYGRLLALAELCYAILTARTNPSNNANRPIDDGPASVAKLMLDKNFVNTLTEALSEVDLNYPSARILISALLKPFEFLTKIAIKLGRAPEPSKEEQERRKSISSISTPSADEITEDAPDLYATSVLGALEGRMESDEMEDEEISTSDEQVYNDDEYDEETGSDVSDVSDDNDLNGSVAGDGDDMDVEIVVRQPLHGHSTMLDNQNDNNDSENEDNNLAQHLEHEDDTDDDHPVRIRQDGADQEMWDVHDQVIIDRVLDSGEIHDGYVDRLNFNWGWNQPGSLFMNDDEFIPGRPSRALFSFGNRRHRHIPGSRRAILEVPPEGLDYVIGDSVGYGFNFGTNDEVDIPGIGRNRPMPGASDDVTTHPLLVNRTSNLPNISGTTGVEFVRGRNVRNGPLSDWTQSIEELIGGGAAQLIEQLLTRSRGLGHSTYRLELNTGSGSLISGIEVDRIFPRSITNAQDNQNVTPPSDPISAVQEFMPVSTGQRWYDEARMMYGNSVSEKATKLASDAVLEAESAAEGSQNVAVDQSMAEGTTEPEEVIEVTETTEIIELGDAMQEDVPDTITEENLEDPDAMDAEPSPAPEISLTTSENNPNMEEEPTTIEGAIITQSSLPAAEGTTEGNETQSARTTVVINGQTIDITDTGIDPTFLEALPEELREEVLNQHLPPERRNRPPVSGAGDAISNEFLEALPDDLREEILQQEAAALEQERRERQRNVEPVAADMDTASFFASLDPHLRRTVLLEQDEMVLASLPPAIVAEANALRERASRRYTNAVRSRTIASTTPAVPTPKKPTIQRDAMKLVDTSGLATLIRLLFLPQPLGNKNLLHKLLLNLCENSKTRGELISMLLSVLYDGSGDVAAVDKSFAQMSLRAKGTSKGTPRRHSNAPNPSLAQITQAAGENVPNLIAQRCLEALTYIVTYNEASVTYFLLEHENNIGLKRSNSRKGKEKQSKSVVSKYPVVILLSLLDRQVFIKNTTLMDQLMHLLSFVLRPLSSLSKQQQQSDNEQNSNNVNQSSNAPNDQNNATASSSKQPGSEKPALKPPVIPDYCLRLVVNVLTAGECTSNTFKYTLSVIQHLSTLSGARDVITSELVERAQILGNDILDDLDELAKILDNANTGVDVQGVTLSKFSPSSSKQAKLLRVLKTIDYMYSRKQQSNTTSSTQVVSLAPTVDPDELESVVPRTLLDSNTRNAKLTDDEAKVMKIYETLNFTELWKRLGKCLTTIHEKPDMIHVATVLLPLIESLMVVCKYVGMTASTNQRISSPGPYSYPPESMEDLFFTFTEDHRKILNTMVRNNPSLMSGSFSLLVHNPKILEFDNKRNYFNQQLHKRTNAREHYGSLQLNVRRQYVFEDSFQNLQRRTGDEIKYGKLSVRFYEEEGVDAGGVTREWFQVLARQMFNENYALFKTSAADRLTYQPNRASGANPEHLLFFKFVGRVIGKAIYDGRLLDAYFTRSFYKHILGKAVDYRDVEAIDLEYYNSLVWMLNNDITGVVDLTFSVETDDFGQKKIVDLKPNGRNIPVTEENKREYVMLVTEQKLTLAIKDQIENFLAGFHEIIPAHLISIFNEQELELLISGMPDIDIDDWKNNTEYQNYTPSSPQIQWFWRAVRSFDQEERAKLLQFVTGTSKVPLEGFSALQGVHGVQKFQIHKDFASPDRLPSAHTCFNQIDIPEYDNYEQLRAQLLLAISEGTTGFGFQ